ncbi:hypothetical protein ACVV7K_003795 [Cronobacter sakazakii]
MEDKVIVVDVKKNHLKDIVKHEFSFITTEVYKRAIMKTKNNKLKLDDKFKSGIVNLISDTPKKIIDSVIYFLSDLTEIIDRKRISYRVEVKDWFNERYQISMIEENIEKRKLMADIQMIDAGIKTGSIYKYDSKRESYIYFSWRSEAEKLKDIEELVFSNLESCEYNEILTLLSNGNFSKALFMMNNKVLADYQLFEKITSEKLLPGLIESTTLDEDTILELKKLHTLEERLEINCVIESTGNEKNNKRRL